MSCLLGVILTRWDTCCDPDEDQNPITKMLSLPPSLSLREEVSGLILPLAWSIFEKSWRPLYFIGEQLGKTRRGGVFSYSELFWKLMCVRIWFINAYLHEGLAHYGVSLGVDLDTLWLKDNWQINEWDRGVMMNEIMRQWQLIFSWFDMLKISECGPTTWEFENLSRKQSSFFYK